MVSQGGINLPAFSKTERDKLQATVLEVWKAECEALGPEAVKLYDDVTAALKE